jgi:hypothetical protein
MAVAVAVGFEAEPCQQGGKFVVVAVDVADQVVVFVFHDTARMP